MAIQFPDTSYIPSAPDKPTTFFDGAFCAIALAASGISAFTTYLGFSYDLPIAVSGVIAFIVGLGLLLINFKIRDHKLTGDSLIGPLVALLLFFSISFISNTNAIYTYFLQKDIVGNTQEEAWRVFDNETGRLISAASNNNKTQAATALHNELKVERENLKQQITDPMNPGLGERALVHLERIETLLGVPLTRLQPASSSDPLEEHIRYAEELDDFINTQYQPKKAVGDDIDAYLSKVKKMRDFYASEINQQRYDRVTTDLMKRDLESLEVDAKTLFGFDTTLQHINNQADETGSFHYTWRNFIDSINPAAIALSILLAIVLDLLTPALSMLLYKQDLEW